MHKRIRFASATPIFKPGDSKLVSDIVFRSLVTNWQNSRSSSCFTSEREICRGRLYTLSMHKRSAASDCRADADEESAPRICTVAVHQGPSTASKIAKKIQSPETELDVHDSSLTSLNRWRKLRRLRVRSFSRTGNPRSRVHSENTSRDTLVTVPER